MRFTCQLCTFLFLVVGLVASQGQDDCVGCAIADFLWNGALGGVDVLKGFFDQGGQEQQQQLDEETGQGVDQNSLPAVQHPLEIFVTSPKECEGKKAGTDANCAVGTRQIIWPSSDCPNNPAEISRIRTALDEIAPLANIGTFNNECGIDFWTGSLTQEQINELLAANVGIQHIVPDSKANYHQDNDDTSIEVDSPVSSNLAEYSRAPGSPALDSTSPNSYAHFEAAGQGTTAYAIGYSFIGGGTEFDKNNNNRFRFLYAEDSTPGPTPDDPTNPSPDHEGCLLSVIGGPKYGVAKHASLVMVKEGGYESSVLSALSVIASDIAARAALGEQTKGQAVISMALGFYVYNNERTINYNEAEKRIRKLMMEHQAVVVASSGNKEGFRDRQGCINQYPALFAQDKDYPLIVVGAMSPDGTMRTSTMTADFLTLTGPNPVECQNMGVDGHITYGTSGATAMVAGAVADYLSRGYVRQHLNLAQNEGVTPPPGGLRFSVAMKMKEYLVYKAWRRAEGGPLCIWNGLVRGDDGVVRYIL